ncbi:MAG: hypothetical protein J6D16_01205 [Clostridia bacterium]|nr:hypothetical protein [Clostridia bacterium]
MLDFGIFEIKTEVFLLILAVLTLALQLVLCFKAKSLALRLLPAILFAVATVVFFTLVFLTDGWDSLGFLLLALCSAMLLAVCGIGFAIWAIVKKRKTHP